MYIFVTRAHWQKLNTPLHDNRWARVECICDMCKWRTELNVLVCCSTCVRKKAIHDGLENHKQVSCTAAEPSSLCHYVTVCEVSIVWLCCYWPLKNFHASNFHHCRPPKNIFKCHSLFAWCDLVLCSSNIRTSKRQPFSLQCTLCYWRRGKHWFIILQSSTSWCVCTLVGVQS